MNAATDLFKYGLTPAHACRCEENGGHWLVPADQIPPPCDNFEECDFMHNCIHCEHMEACHQ
jgi:hypothetical protein